jgi:hypothetical protein
MFKRFALAAAVTMALAAPVSAATINYSTAGTQADIPGLTGFATTGAMMDGMQVTACFSVSGCQTLSWADTGANSGGVSGNGWGLSVNGDTFSANIWQFFIDTNANVGQLLSLLLDGRSSFTVFDRTNPSTGTPGSAQGRDFNTSVGDVIDVTYLNPTAIIPGSPVGDLFQAVLIEFAPGVTGGPSGPRSSFTFSQDTDNDIRITQVPEPGSLALLAVGALGLALSRRRRG